MTLLAAEMGQPRQPCGWPRVERGGQTPWSRWGLRAGQPGVLGGVAGDPSSTGIECLTSVGHPQPPSDAEQGQLMAEMSWARLHLGLWDI